MYYYGGGSGCCSNQAGYQVPYYPVYNTGNNNSTYAIILVLFIIPLLYVSIHDFCSQD